jgi:Ferritin-like domain
VTSRDPIQISEHELVVMTAELDDMHHDSMPKLYESVAEWADMGKRRVGGVSATRRGFLTGGGLAIGGLILAACGSSGSKKPSSGATTGGTTTTSMGATANHDLDIAALATSLENLAVATYQGGIDAATAGKLGTVPPAVVTFAQTAQKQHKDHAAAWNAILTGAGKSEVTGVDMTVKTAVIDPAFAKVKDVGALAMLALQLEEVAAATYLASIDLLVDPGGIKTSASIHPVELQHAAILNFVLGQYPVPRSFSTTDGARALSDKIG